MHDQIVSGDQILIHDDTAGRDTTPKEFLLNRTDTATSPKNGRYEEYDHTDDHQLI